MCLMHKWNKSDWMSNSALAMFHFLSFSLAQTGLNYHWSNESRGSHIHWSYLRLDGSFLGHQVV